MTTNAARSPRAPVFSAAACEIDKVDMPNTPVVLGAIGVFHDALAGCMGKGPRDLAACGETKLSLLRSAVEESQRVRVRNVVHLYQILLPILKATEDGNIGKAKKYERQSASALAKRISEKLCNGHAGTWI